MSGFLDVIKNIFGALLNMNSAVLVPIFLLIIAMKLEEEIQKRTEHRNHQNRNYPGQFKAGIGFFI